MILRYLNSLLLILFVSIAATSCSDDNHKIIEQPSINVLSYYPKSMNIVELQYKPAGQEPGVVDFGWVLFGIVWGVCILGIV